MKEEPTMKPLHAYVLIRIPPAEEKIADGGIIIPDAAKQGSLKAGIVQAIGPKVPLAEQGPQREIQVGQTVLFDPKGEETIGIREDRVLVPYPAVFASLQDAGPPVTPPPTCDFFKVPQWDDFIGGDHAAWEQYQNLTLFSVKVKFLEPFDDLKPLARRMHECCVRNVRGLPELDLESVRYATKDADMITLVTDDVWYGMFTVDPKNSYIDFQKQATDVPTVHKTAPRLLTAFANALGSPEFQKVGGDDYSRVTCVVIRFHQRLKIEGRGARRHDATNSELMRQFLLFGQKGDHRATLDALAVKPAQIGRIDMKISFQKTVDDHEYRVFLNVEAPANDEHTIMEIEWEIQDHNPGIVPARQYGPLFTTFFRDIVMRSFYKRWFQENDDIVCSTSKR